MAVCVSIMDHPEEHTEEHTEGHTEEHTKGHTEGHTKGHTKEHVGSGEATAPLLVGGQQMSEACVSGTIQLPPDGNPVILLAEHQTTGGYSVPGVVIQADLWQVGQMRPGDTLQFVHTTEEQARKALHVHRSQAVDTAINVSSGNAIDMHRLSSGINQLGNQHTYGGGSGSHDTEFDDEGSLAAKPREQDLQLYWSEVKAFWYLPLVHVWHTVDDVDAY